MLYGLTQSTAPTVEPVSLEEARKQVALPLNYTAHDSELVHLITAARQRAEAITGRQLCTATWDLYLEQFPADNIIRLPKPPLSSVTSITYVDLDGSPQTWSSANYVVSTSREPGVVRLAYGISLPSVRYQPDAIRVRYVAGYGGASAVPSALKAALLLTLAHWFDHRTSVVVGTTSSAVPESAMSLLDHYAAGDEFVDYAGVCY